MSYTVNKGVSGRRPRLLFYGCEKIGLSSFVAKAFQNIFLTFDDSADFVDVTKLKIKTYEELMECLEELMSPKSIYKTIVIDRITGVERLIHKMVADHFDVVDIAQVPYNKGTSLALHYFQVFLDKLRSLKATVIFLSHADSELRHTPFLETYHCQRPRLLTKTDKANTADILLSFCDGVFYVGAASVLTSSYMAQEPREDIFATDPKFFIYTQDKPGFRAGNKLNLPPVINFDWKDFSEKLVAARATIKKETKSPEVQEQEKENVSS